MFTSPPCDRRSLQGVKLSADLAVVGGGLAGACCAITAARAGLRVVLLQDRPVLGGNASSEVRLWILGATSHMGNNNRWAREGGVVDEILVGSDGSTDDTAAALRALALPRLRVFEFPEVEDVARATVSITWTKPDGRTEAQQAQSGSDGTARFRLPADQAGTYTLTVVDLAKGRKVYNPARNLETSESVASP